jgi:hypothetical protein
MMGKMIEIPITLTLPDGSEVDVMAQRNVSSPNCETADDVDYELGPIVITNMDEVILELIRSLDSSDDDFIEAYNDDEEEDADDDEDLFSEDLGVDDNE